MTVNGARKLTHRHPPVSLGCAQPNDTFARLTYCSDEVESGRAMLSGEIKPDDPKRPFSIN